MHQDAILRAARRIASAGGTLRMSSVAAKAGVSRATLYRAFSSRRALLEALQGEGVALAEPPDAERRVMDAMRRLLLREGFGGLTMEAVAAEAGASLATVYRRFGDRAGLLRAFARVGDDARASIASSLQGRIASREELRQALLRFTESSLSALEEHRPLFLLAFSAPGEIRAAIRRVRDARRGAVAALAAFLDAQMKAGLLRQDDARALAALYVGQLLATALLLPEVGEALPPASRVAPLLVRTLLEGLYR